MVPEAPLEDTGNGLVATGEGWFVLNAREARWRGRPGMGHSIGFQGDTHFPQLGIGVVVLAPGEPMAMYHWETDQEDFLVLAGEALLIVEGEERPLRTWDFVHCPAETNHVIVGAGETLCTVLCVGARTTDGTDDWGAYSVDKTAIRHGAGIEEEATDEAVAYARFPATSFTPYSDGWLPG